MNGWAIWGMVVLNAFAAFGCWRAKQYGNTLMFSCYAVACVGIWLQTRGI